LEDPLIQFYICHPITDPPGLRRRLKNAVKRIIHRGTVASVSGTIGLVIENPGKVDLSSCKLESLPYPDGCMDLLMCVNVLDHVNDCDECIGQIHRVLKPGGVLVLGQDLTNDEDLRSCEECRLDIGHPIKIDHAYIGRSLQPYSAIFGRVLDREEGRTPAAHYGTYLGILRKN
jgi:SAM-dependent methyltransferase